MVPRLSPWAIKFCPWYRFDPLVPKCWPQLPKSFVPLVGAVRVVGVIEVVGAVGGLRWLGWLRWFGWLRWLGWLVQLGWLR